MARPLWKGFLTFGLVSVPCALASMERPEKEINFTLLDKRDRARIRYSRINERTGKEVPWKDIAKGHEVREGEYVLLTPEELKRAAPKATRSIELSGFVKAADVPPWYFERPYLVQPLAGGEKGYALLAAALKDSDLLGVARIVLHTRQHLAALISDGAHLVLNTMRFGEELRKPSEIEHAADVSSAKATKQEIEMAQTLIKGMTIDWAPSRYHDEYREALRKWIAQRAKKGAQAIAPEEDEEPVAGPYNIMDMLKKSIESQKHSPKRAAPTRRKAG